MWQRLMNLDRRWIFLSIALIVAAPFIFSWALPLGSVSPSTKAVYDALENLAPGTPVMICFDYGPASMAELQPMAEALSRHAFKRGLRLLGVSLDPQGIVMCQLAFTAAARQTGAREGVHFVNLGFRPGYLSVILGMGSDISQVYRTDHRGKPLADLPCMAGVRNYGDIGLVIDLAATSAPGDWIRYAQGRYHAPLALGITAVMATDWYPYLQAKQIKGLIVGLKGAAEYESLVKYPGLASLGMTSQSVAHLAIILFVVAGNLGYFATRRRR
jgi:hypothetical protein